MTRTTASATVFGLFAAGLFSGAWLGGAALARAQDPYQGLDLFARVLTLVEQQYVDDAEQQLLIEAAVNGMLDELDPHSRFLSADEYRAFQESSRGSYEGIGIEVRIADNGVYVARVLEGGPAQRDGLLAGDILTHADGVSLVGMSLDEVSKHLKAARGTPLTLTVLRDGWAEPRSIHTVRDRIITPAVYAEMLDERIAYVRLVHFSETTSSELQHKLSELNSFEGMVLDLRDNSGGLLDQAVEVVDLFLDDGVIVSTRGRHDPEKVYRATPGGLPDDLPVVVLINGMSASASEIVAAALQDAHRAPLVGTQTYGKGSVQVLFENPDASAVKLTIGRYYTPSGAPVAAREGRLPDHEVLLEVAQDPYEELQKRLTELDRVDDTTRDELLALLRQLPHPKQEQPPISWDGPAATRVLSDAQLSAAVELLNETLSP